MPEGRLTVKQAAALVPVSLAMMYQWVAEKRFEVFRAGGKGRCGKILIDEAAFRAFLESLKVGAAENTNPQPQPIKQQFRHVKL